MPDDQHHSRLQSTPPILGTAWVEAQYGWSKEDALSAERAAMSSPSSSLCLDLSEFRRLLQRSRKLDDTIALSFNRASILSGSLEPNPASKGFTPGQNGMTEACGQFWKLLTENWSSREKLIKSCIDIVDDSVQKKKASIDSLLASTPDPVRSSKPAQNSTKTSNSRAPSHSSPRELEAEVYTAELKRRMIHDELAVESTIRKQSVQKFKTYCPASTFAISSDSSDTKFNSDL